MSHNILIAFVFLAVGATLSCGFNIRPMVEMDVLDTLMKSSVTMQTNPERTKLCFDTYKPHLEELSDTYKRKYDECLDTANTGKEAIIKEVGGNVASITQWRHEICNGYSNCQGSEVYPFFECNNKAAGEAVTTSFNIQTMSKDRMQYVQLRSEMIEYDVKTCTDKASQSYTVDSKVVYDQLQACLSAEQTTTVAA